MTPDPTSIPDQSLQVAIFDPNAPQPFNTLPNELLLSTFQCLDPAQRCLLLSICKKWNDTLLDNRSIWQTLVLGKRFGFERSLQGLQIFSSRSHLKHVCLGFKIRNYEKVLKIVGGLKNCSETLRVLSLVSDKFQEDAKREVRKHLPKLNTLYLMDSLEYRKARISNLLLEREKLGVIDLDEGLKLFRCTHFKWEFGEDADLFSRLTCLQISGRCNEWALRELLEACQFTLKYLVLGSWIRTDELINLLPTEEYEFYDRIDREKEKIQLKNLVRLGLPCAHADDEIEAFGPDAMGFEAEALARLISIEEGVGENLRLKGEVKALLLFKISSLRNLWISLYDEEFKQDRENLTSEALPATTETLFALNTSVKQLTLECSFTATGGETHLNSILKTLCAPSKRTSGTTLGEGEVEEPVLQVEETTPLAQTNDSQKDIFLPGLVKLNLRNPVKLDGKLLKRLIQERRNITEGFAVEVTDSKLGKEVLIEDWEARDWMD